MCEVTKPICDEKENIVRAYRTSDYDEEEARFSSSLFKGEHISVARLSITNINDLYEIWRQLLDRPPEELVIGALEYNIGSLVKIAKEFKANPTDLIVREDPLNEPIKYEAHACAPQKISPGLSKEILRNFLLQHKFENTK